MVFFKLYLSDSGLSASCTDEKLKNEDRQDESTLSTLKSKWSENTLKAFKNLKTTSGNFFTSEGWFIVLQTGAGGSWPSYWVDDEIRKMKPAFYEKIKLL